MYNAKSIKNETNMKMDCLISKLTNIYVFASHIWYDFFII
jgi:hypothetical protein